MEGSMKDSQLITFEHKDIGEVKGFIKDGEPWFLAGQVCRCLGIKDASTAVAQVEERMKIADYKGAVSNRTLLETKGGKQKVIVIPEPFLYELIFASRKQKAIIFRTWVTTEVLPALRKTGFYRLEGKLIRHTLTDTLDKSGETERMHGHSYSTYTRLVNKSLGLPPKNNKDELPPETLEQIARRENTVTALLNEGKKYDEIKPFIESLKTNQTPSTGETL
jgi:prophage antirepressor-like protein